MMTGKSIVKNTAVTSQTTTVSLFASTYQAEFRGGKCPPGLSRKNNGCLPRGQAKKWHLGHRLPSDIVYYELPPAVIIQLPRPSAGHRYVRVASDILLIAVGTGMVIDAIQDLSRM